MSTAITEAAEFGDAVRQHREDRGWTRPQLVTRLRQVDPGGLWNVPKVTNLERGAVRHPPLKTIRLLSIVLGCDVTELVWPTDRQSACYDDSPSDLRELAAA